MVHIRQDHQLPVLQETELTQRDLRLLPVRAVVITLQDHLLQRDHLLYMTDQLPQEAVLLQEV